jgi:xanthine dehydrogenase iron-sulfur cluster and FAD-binding subunit A
MRDRCSKEFVYVAPTTLREAIEALSGNNARTMVGGTDVLVQLRAGRLTPDRMVDVKKVPELNALTYSDTAVLTIGTQEELARAVGTSVSAVSRFESGQHPTTVQTLERFAKALGLEIDISFREPATVRERERVFA